MKKTDKAILLFLVTSAIGAFTNVEATQSKANQRTQAAKAIQNNVDLLTKKIMMKFNGVTNLQIPNTFKKIDDYACVRNSVVENVLIENGVEEIGVRAFAKCKNLNVVYIPNSIKKIGRNAFYMPNDNLKIVIGGTYQQIQQMYKLLENHIDVSQITILCSKSDSNRVKQKYANSTIKIINGNVDVERIKAVLHIDSVKVISYQSDISIEIEKLLSEISHSDSNITYNEEEQYDENNSQDEETDEQGEYVDNELSNGETVVHTIKNSILSKQIISMVNARKIDWSAFLGEYDENDTIIIESPTSSHKITVAEFKKVVLQTRDNLKKNKIKKGNVGKNLDISFKNVIKNRKEITIGVRKQNNIDISGFSDKLDAELADYDDNDIVSINVNEQIYLLTVANLKSAVQKFVTDFYSRKLDENEVYNIWTNYVSSLACESDDYVADVMIDWSLKESGNTSDLLMRITIDKYNEEAVIKHIPSHVPTPVYPSPAPNPVTQSPAPTLADQSPAPNPVNPSPAPTPADPSPAPNPIAPSPVPTPVDPSIKPNPVNPTTPVSVNLAIGTNVQNNTGNLIISIPQSMPEHILINIKSIISKLNEIFTGFYDTDVVNVTFGENSYVLTVAELKFAVTKVFAEFNNGKIIDNTKLAKVFLKRMHLLEKARLIREISSKAIANVSVVYTMTPSTDDNKQTTTLDVDINISRIDDNEDRQAGNITLTVDSDVIKQDEKKEGGEIIQKSAFLLAIEEVMLNKPECAIVNIACDASSEDKVFTEEIANQFYDDNGLEDKANYGVRINGYTTIDKHAFEQLNNFTSIALVDVNNELPKGVFSGCKDMKWIEFSEAIQKIPEEAFEKCTNLERIIIPENINSLGESAFAGCSKLSTIIFKGNKVNIGDKAFSRCGKLTSLYIPDTAVFSNSKKGKSNPIGAFDKCKIDTIKVYIRVVSTRANAEKLKNELISKFKVLEENIFIEGAHDVVEKSTEQQPVEEANNGETIKYEHVYQALATREDFQKHFVEGLKGKLSAPLHLGVIGEFTVPQNGQFSSIQRALFANWAGLNKVIVPQGYKVIGAAAFTNCENLLEVNIADSVEEIQPYTFAGCKKLRKVELSNGLLSIDTRTFLDCVSLENVTIPNGVSYIGSKAFEGCVALTNVSIPTTVGGIVKDAFKNCPNVKFEIRYVHDDDESEDEAIERVNGLLNKLKK